MVLGGCQSQRDFDLGTDESYCGYLSSAGFLTRGWDRDTVRMELHGYTSRQAACPAGTLTTDDGTLEGSVSELRPIEVLAHDPLSQLQFGDGRVENEMYFIRSTRRQDLLAVVSLMHDGSVEVRLLGAAQAPAGSGEDAGPGLPPCTGGPDAGLDDLPETALFGLFHLRRQRAGCF